MSKNRILPPKQVLYIPLCLIAIAFLLILSGWGNMTSGEPTSEDMTLEETIDLGRQTYATGLVWLKYTSVILVISFGIYVVLYFIDKKRQQKESLEIEAAKKEIQPLFDELEHEIPISSSAAFDALFMSLTQKLMALKSQSTQKHWQSEVVAELDRLELLINYNQKVLKTLNELEDSWNRQEYLRVIMEFEDIRNSYDMNTSILKKKEDLKQKISKYCTDEADHLKLQFIQNTRYVEDPSNLESLKKNLTQWMNNAIYLNTALYETMKEYMRVLQLYTRIINLFKGTQKLLTIDVADLLEMQKIHLVEIGRASCRERV